MTEQRPIQPTPVGALRFNADSSKLEYFDGNQYVNITTDSPEQILVLSLSVVEEGMMLLCQTMLIK